MEAIPTIVFIALLAGLIFALVFVVKCWLFGRHLVKNFKASNVVVDGKKGKGKDLLFQYVINKRKAPYYGNISYGGKFTPIDLKDVSIAPNTYENFIDGKVVEVKRCFEEKKDFYISDGGVYLPSYADSLLHKAYKSMPLFYPMSRHISNANVHVNVQNCARLWKPLREQADFFVHVRGHVKLPFFIFVHATTYDKEDSAVRCLLPMKGRLFNKYSKAERDQYQAENGEIKDGWIAIRKKSIRYDTRAFEKVIFGEQARIEPQKE